MRTHKGLRSITGPLALVVALLGIGPAFGQEFYSDRASFLAYAPGTTVIDFNNAVPGEYPNNDNGGYLTRGSEGVTLSGVNMVGVSAGA
ncbi:MAG: hypothetical protein FJX72_08605 [Armatimonadetes bacterium]|nr:hypothetical protein [Armatimonadota bacterium]